MKKVLGIILCVVMLVSSVSAALPLEQDKTVDPSVTESVLVAAQTYEDSTYKFFTKKQNDSAGIVTVKENPDDVESNTVMELKYSALLTFEEGEGEDGATTQTVLTTPKYNNAQLIDGTQSTNTLSDGTVIPTTYMVEFDVCAKDNSVGLVFTRRCLENGVQAAVAIDPDSMTEGTWYTFRFYVDETAYRAVVATAADGKLTTAEANAARAAFVSGVTAFGKERGSSADFVDVTSNLISTAAGNGAMGFVLLNNASSSNDKALVAEDIDQNKTYYMESSKRNVFVDAFSACYQLDNITLYNHTVPEDYEINAGICNTIDMEAVKTVNAAVVYEQAYEENGNGYMKLSLGNIDTNTELQKRYLNDGEMLTNDMALGDYFSINFDANNLVAGFPLSFEIYTDMDGEDATTQGRLKVVLESDVTRENTWYSYKIICDDSANTKDLNVKVYRRLRGSNDEWTDLAIVNNGAEAAANPQKYDIFINSTASSGAKRAHRLRIGCYAAQLSAYALDATDEKGVLKNLNGVWALDNIQTVAGAGVTGTASVADGTVTAKINVSGAKMSCAPIVAIYDETGRFVDLGSAKVSGEGAVRVMADGYQEGYSAKLFIWDELSEGMPLLNGIDITDYL